MPLSLPKTAVLLFAQADAAEAERKGIVRRAARLWRSLRSLVQANARVGGLPLLHSRRLIDHRGTFGEQLSAAVAAAFAQGYERIICVGNDCPDLATTDLRRAARALADGQLPLGADQRGGVYLVGFTRKQFDPEALANLPWQTDSLAESLRGYLDAHRQPIAELPVRADLNQRADARAVRWEGRVARGVLNLIRLLLLAPAPASFSDQPLAVVSFASRAVCGRAPPAF